MTRLGRFDPSAPFTSAPVPPHTTRLLKYGRWLGDMWLGRYINREAPFFSEIQTVLAQSYLQCADGHQQCVNADLVRLGPGRADRRMLVGHSRRACILFPTWSGSMPTKTMPWSNSRRTLVLSNRQRSSVWSSTRRCVSEALRCCLCPLQM
jgi:hypothetical protein